MFKIIGRFRVATGQDAAFAPHDADNGSWVKRFGRDSAWWGTRLRHHADQAGVQLSIGPPDPAETYAPFRQRHAGAHNELDRRCEALTIQETLPGHLVHAV